MPQEKLRQSNIELLRILSIIGVIFLHFNNSEMGGGFKFVEPQTINYWILLVLEALSIGAVNLFILISGYFMGSSYKRKIAKPGCLLCQVMLFGCLNYIMNCVFRVHDFSFRSLIISAIPINYFAILYIALYIVSPYINFLVSKLTDRQFVKMMITVLAVFSLWNIAVDLLMEKTNLGLSSLSTISANGSQRGYTIVNFILMYLIGIFLKRFENKIHIKNRYLVLIIVGLTIGITFWTHKNSTTALEYLNPFVIALAIAFFLLFRNIPMGTVKPINELAKGAFSVFLLHTFFIDKLHLDKIVGLNPFVMLVLLIAFAIGIYLICWIVYEIYDHTLDRLFRYLLGKIKLELGIKE